ncbi:MAG: hypothetical protein ACI8QC_000617 [Planctomycetota bacterium]|jgi:hypothetical protein
MSVPQPQDPALFRIERKELLEQRKAEKKKLQLLQEVRTSELVIGTLSTSGLVLDDPVAAESHCAIVHEGGQFFIKDLPNASGTYLNGIRIQGQRPVKSGDRIALGVAILELSINPEQPASLDIAVREGAFFHTIKRRGEFASDADEWVRSEVQFGRMPLLRRLNVLACLVAAVAIWWFSTQPAGQAALQPAKLAFAHSQFFSDMPPRDTRLAFMVELAQEQGCNACHDSYGQPSSEKCASCHVEVIADAEAGMAHPFESQTSLVCIDCHKEHHGSQPAMGVLSPGNITERCADCHEDDMATPEAISSSLALAIAEHRIDLAPTSNAMLARVPSSGYEAFDHMAHSAIEDCSTCHTAMAAPGVIDFVPLAFKDCAECHSPDSSVTGTSLPAADKRWNVTWHGAGNEGENCEQCHVEVFQPALRSVEQLAARPLAFDISLRSHADVFDHAGGEEDCSSCHKTGAAAQPGRLLSARPFEHDIHLSALLPGPGASAEQLNQQCAECHTDIAASLGIVAAPDAFSGPPLTSCANCHKEADGTALITSGGSPLATTVARQARTRPDFPHDRHTAVEGGCLACHEFGSLSDPQLGFAMASTPEDVASCVRCHMERAQGTNQAHTNIGGGQCANCHTPQDGITLASVFRAPQPPATVSSNFPHQLEAHRRATCVECHGDPKIADVHSPAESASSCRECHAASRFHWR